MATMELKPIKLTESEGDGDTKVVLKDKVQTKRPPLYSVILLNDDYTPMEFVVSILERHFKKDHATATDIMLKVHNEGRAVCGVYPYEIAETKVTLVTEEAKQNGHPLQCTLERA
jgi:ATP-dependent Clp protease adaptor protein ClpS